MSVPAFWAKKPNVGTIGELTADVQLAGRRQAAAVALTRAQVAEERKAERASADRELAEVAAQRDASQARSLRLGGWVCDCAVCGARE